MDGYVQERLHVWYA